MSARKIVLLHDPDNGLLPFGNKILRHWRKHRPKMCRELEKRGTLVKVVESVQDLVLNTEADLRERGMGFYEAREYVLPMWALPDERGEPESDYEALESRIGPTTTETTE